MVPFKRRNPPTSKMFHVKPPGIPTHRDGTTASSGSHFISPAHSTLLQLSRDGKYLGAHAQLGEESAPVTPQNLHRRAQISTIPVVLSELRLRELLQPFGLELTSRQAWQVLSYLDLLLHWNQKINLTAIREPEACVTRHFGESLFLARHAKLHGHLLDIGSGAGFPGLALKIPFPALALTLLEPVAKKRAFLKEAARTCEFEEVEVRGERLDDLVRTMPPPAYDTATARAVGKLHQLVPLAEQAVKPGGVIFLWLSHDQTAGLSGIEATLTWGQPIPIPLSRSGEIWRGRKSIHVERQQKLRYPH